MKNILFYKYTKLEKLEKFRQEHLHLCNNLGLKGKVLVAEEGINGCLTGSSDSIDEYVKAMMRDARFSDIDFKTCEIKQHGFKRMLVKIKNEIITTRLDKDLLDYKAPYVEPKEFKKWLDSDKDVVIIDGRNDYESEVGTFTNAIKPDVKSFSDFPAEISKLEHLKNKTIVTYCTGGIRCEKFSGWMVKNGFKDVYQLHGGIVKYGIEVGDSHWQGECMVFDRRGSIPLDPNKQKQNTINCVVCFLPTDNKSDCSRSGCKNSYHACDSCQEILENTCSKSCRNHVRMKNMTTLVVSL